MLDGLLLGQPFLDSYTVESQALVLLDLFVALSVMQCLDLFVCDALLESDEEFAGLVEQPAFAITDSLNLLLLFW